MKDLTIYIPTYNRGEKLDKTLHDICIEIDGKHESEVCVVINDNSSTDFTEQVVTEYSKSRSWIIYHKNETNVGILGNAYASIQFADSLYMWIVSDDDHMCEGCVSRVLQIIHDYDYALEYIHLNFRGQFENDLKNNELKGFYKDAFPSIVKSKDKWVIGGLGFTNNIVFKKTSAEKTFQLLPLGSEVSYGWTVICSLVAINNGNSFFEDKLWVIHLDENVSWSNAVYNSVRGTYFSFRRLKKIGINKKLIHFFEKQYYLENHIINYSITQIYKKKEVYRLFDIIYFWLKYPKVVSNDILSVLRGIREHYRRKY